MHLVVYESADFGSFAPFTFFRPTFLMRSGASTLLEKQLRALQPDRVSLWVRPELEALCRQHAGSAVSINQPLDDSPAVLCDGRALLLNDAHNAEPVTAAGLSSSDALTNSDRWKQLTIDSPFRLAIRPWDLLSWNAESLAADFAALRSTCIAGTSLAGPFHIVNGADVLLGEGVKLQPGCVIDASDGPVHFAAGVTVGANAVVHGPCSIGERSEIAPLCVIRPRTSIGPRCKIGGEVSASIVQGYSSKGHDGFLGDSYLGEWVNFGAGTTTSNLKNTYGPVTMHGDGKQLDTGRQFLGSLVGDHSKTAIGTRLMTGTYVGACSMIATSNYPSRFVPSFQFCTDGKADDYRIDKAIEVARAVYGRRQRDFTPNDEAIMRAAAEWAKSIEFV